MLRHRQGTAEARVTAGPSRPQRAEAYRQHRIRFLPVWPVRPRKQLTRGGRFHQVPEEDRRIRFLHWREVRWGQRYHPGIREVHRAEQSNRIHFRQQRWPELFPRQSFRKGTREPGDVLSVPAARFLPRDWGQFSFLPCMDHSSFFGFDKMESLVVVTTLL